MRVKIMRIKWKKFVVLSLAVALFGTNTISMAEEVIQSRRFSILSISGDEAYVIKGSTKEVKATAGMPLGQGSKIRTGVQTSLYVEADDDKTIKLDSNTQAEITKVSSKSLKITLKSGEIFFNVEKPLEEGEELTFDAAQTSMSIRGTSGALSYSQDGITFFLIEGEVHWNIGNQVVSLSAGQKAVLAPDSQEQLQANGMKSIYRLDEMREFSWQELSPMVLEALIQQMENIDVSAIGLDRPEVQEQVGEWIQQAKQEQQAREEAQMRSQEQAWAAMPGNGGAAPVRIDGGEPETRRSEGRRSSGGRGSETTEGQEATTAKDPTTEEEPTAEEPTTTERPTEGTSGDEPTTEEPTTTEPPTEGTSGEEPTTEEPTTTEPPTEGTSGEEPETEEPTTTESPTEGTSGEEPTTEEPTTTEPPTEGTSGEEPTTEEPTTTEPPTEGTSGKEPTTEEPTTTEPPTEGTSGEEPTTEEPTTTEPPTEETSEEESTTEEPTVTPTPTEPPTSTADPEKEEKPIGWVDSNGSIYSEPSSERKPIYGWIDSSGNIHSDSELDFVYGFVYGYDSDGNPITDFAAAPVRSVLIPTP